MKKTVSGQAPGKKEAQVRALTPETQPSIFADVGASFSPSAERQA
jgi:hypothetical protein